MIPAIPQALGPLNLSEWSVGGLCGGPSGAAGTASPSAVLCTTDPSAVSGTNSGSFSTALASAIDYLDTSQTNATSAAQQLATGTATDPTAAVTAVENASLAMDLASQIRTKLVDATNQIFQTQV